MDRCFTRIHNVRVDFESSIVETVQLRDTWGRKVYFFVAGLVLGQFPFLIFALFCRGLVRASTGFSTARLLAAWIIVALMYGALIRMCRKQLYLKRGIIASAAFYLLLIFSAVALWLAAGWGMRMR